MMYRLLIGILLLCELANAQFPQAAASFQALGTDVPFGSSFSGRNFPQIGPEDAQFSLGVSMLYYPELPAFGRRFLAANYLQGMFHLTGHLESSGDELYSQQTMRIHTGMRINSWRMGVGVWRRQIKLEQYGSHQWLTVAGVSTQIQQKWSLHCSLQAFAFRQKSNVLADPAMLQSHLMLVHHHHKTHIIFNFSYYSLLGNDVGLGVGYQFHKDFEFDWAGSLVLKRMSFGLRYRYQDFNLRISVMQQQLPGLWWQSAADWHFRQL
jgi:hypothetical protein